MKGSDEKYCPDCGNIVKIKAEICPSCGCRQKAATKEKSKTTAALLAFFLGGIGVHKFYLGQYFWGVLYVLFCWTYIPTCIALVEAIILLCTSEDKFNSRFCKES